MFSEKKILIYIWGDEWDLLYYELLKPGETVTGKYYSLQLNHLAKKKSMKNDLIRDVGIRVVQKNTILR